MSGTSIPSSLQQDNPSSESEPFVTAELLPEAVTHQNLARPDRGLNGALKKRIQAGTAHFEFDALLQGVSTLQSPQYTPPEQSSPALESTFDTRTHTLSRSDAPFEVAVGTTAKQNRINPKDGAELVWIPAGEFLMGSLEGERREQPVHRVFVDGFWIYKTQVTVQSYRRFCLETGRSFKHAPPWGWHDEHPMINVSWVFASAYAAWAGGSLPTEAEWEKAARGTDGRQFPWGNEWDGAKCCNASGRWRDSVDNVDSYPEGASPYGVLNMAGNVWEWTADWYEEIYYLFSPDSNPTGPESGTHRVLRGGSWGNNLTHDYRTTTRMACEPVVRGTSIGFRCVVRDDAFVSNGSS